MKKLLFLGSCLLMITALSSCRGNSGKAAAAAGAAIINEVVNDNEASGSKVSFKGNNKVPVKVKGVDCKGRGGSLCSCTIYIGYTIEGTDNYIGPCENYVNGHRCGHSPSAHGL